MNKCTIPDCDGKHLARGLCNLHYHRWRRYGNPLMVTKPPKKDGEARIDTEGYLRLRGGFHVHRQVAAEKLGRPLRKNEIVHHIDGNKTNNAPDNLEIVGSRAEHIKHHRHHMHRNYK
jgi:HNH endonuclease